MVRDHAGKCTDHHQIAPGLLAEVILAGCFDTILYLWQCFRAELREPPLDGFKILHYWQDTETIQGICFHLQTIDFPDVPNSQTGASSDKITLHQSSADQS